MRSPVLLSLFLLSSAIAGAAPLSGIYTAIFDAPVYQYGADGINRQTGTARTTEALELNSNGTFRTATTNDHGKQWYARGVWIEQGNRVFAITEAVTPAGAPLTSTSLASERITADDHGLQLDEPVPHSFVVSAKLTRVSTADLGPQLQADVADLKPVLKSIVRTVPRAPYAPVESEEELKTLIGRAVSTRDVQALLRVSYPTLADLSADAQLGYYLEYMDALGLPGKPQVLKFDGRTVVQQELEKLNKCCGCAFPAGLDVRGCFMLERTSPDGRVSGTGFFYGIVNGRWAIVGSPIDTKAAEAFRRAKQHG